MEYIKFNKTDLKISPLCLGTVNYDTLLSKEDSKRQLSQFVDMGGNFIDSAHIYGDWEPPVLCRSEKTIGEWIKETGKRDQLVISTKGSHPDWGHMDISRVWPKDIRKDLDESLIYLNTNYIDLYFLHRDDPNVPVSQIIDCLDDVVKAGKIRYYGCSNWGLPRIKEAQAYAKEKGSPGFVCNQLMWSLADINFNNLPDKTFILMDKETHDYHSSSGMNVMAYMSIAKAYFTRRLKGEQLPESVTSVYENNSNDQIFGAGRKMVEQGDYSFIDLSFMYIMGETGFPSVPIASFDTPEQLKLGIQSLEKKKPTKLLNDMGNYKKFVYNK